MPSSIVADPAAAAAAHATALGSDDAYVKLNFSLRLAAEPALVDVLRLGVCCCRPATVAERRAEFGRRALVDLSCGLLHSASLPHDLVWA